MTSPTPPHHDLTIGVFDSGFGGLTVLHDLLPLIPNANYIYLGDTARLPYGSKSRETIVRYALSSARFLLAQGADLLVIACNTATALALDEIRADLPIPIIGVIQPGAQAAAHNQNEPPQNRVPHLRDGLIVAKVGEAPQTTPESQVIVLATTATIQSHAYAHALNALNLQATEKACPLLVPLVEEGWVDHPVTAEVLRIYVSEALADAPHAGTLLLGCTHYPLIKPLIASTLQSLGHPLHIIDSAYATAQATAAVIATQLPNLTQSTQPTRTFYATDSVEKFRRLGSSFLGQPLDEVHLINLGG
jgi:glutamate racemase